MNNKSARLLVPLVIALFGIAVLFGYEYGVKKQTQLSVETPYIGSLQKEVKEANLFIGMGLVVALLTGCGAGGGISADLGDFADSSVDNSDSAVDPDAPPVIVLPPMSAYHGAASN